MLISLLVTFKENNILFKLMLYLCEMLKAYKYKLSPTKAQIELINKHIGAVRFVFNLGLECKNYAYASNRKNLSCFDLNNQLPELKKECEWLKEINAQSLQQSITNLDKAFTQFFHGHAAFPNFKKKNRGTQSFRCQQGIKIKENKIIIPKFKEGIKFVQDRIFEGEIKSTTISRTPTNKYFVSVLVDNHKELPKKKPIKEQTAIGIDLGIKSFIVTSNGLKIDNPKHLKKALLHLKYLQRQVSKKKKGGANRKKAVYKLAIQLEKITNQRKDFLHKLSSKLISENQTLCFEDLNISGMIKNHKLAQSIGDCGWGMFVDMCKYKAEWSGDNILQIPTFAPSTKLCNVCGAVNHTLTLKDREWTCANCLTTHDRDTNAAIVIKKYCLKEKGRRLYASKSGELLPMGKVMNQK
jgi:putative transposase